jgi:hypothetical protein
MTLPVCLDHLSEIQCVGDNVSDHEKNVATNVMWKRTTLNANTAFGSGLLVYANCLYESAVAQAQFIFKNNECNRQTVAIILASFHNLADFYLQNNNKSDAVDCLHQAVSFLSYARISRSNSIGKDTVLIWGLTIANRQLWLVEKKYKSSTINELVIH